MGVLRVHNGFPLDGRLRRLHWVGPIVPRYGGNGAMLKVLVVPYVGSTREPHALSNWQNYDWGAEAEVILDAGMTPNLVVGSIWVDGLFGEYPDYQTFTCRVRVPEAKLPAYAPREKIDDVSIVPKITYPMPGGSAQSKMLVLSLAGENAYLVLPCSEVFRFYYGSSTKLATMMLDGTWITESWRVVGRRSTIDTATRKAFLEIGPYHDNADHVDIAQMYFGKIARRESSDLIKHAIRASTQREYPLSIGLPFEGNGTLVVRGIEYMIGKKRAILAYQIVTSRHRYPWSSLDYGRATNNGSDSAEEVGNAGTFLRTSAIASGESVKVVQNADPGSNELPHDIASPLSPNRYLTPTEATYVEHKGDRSGARQYETVVAPATHFAMGAGRRDSSLRRAALVTGDERGTPHRFELFIGAMHELKAFVDGGIVHHDVYDLPHPRVNGDAMETGLSLFDRAVTRWAFIDGHHRWVPRRVVIARLIFRGVPLIVFDIEPRDKKIRSGEPDDEKTALRLLRAPRPQAIDDGAVVDELRKTIVDAKGVIGGRLWKESRFGAWPEGKLWHIAAEDPKSYAQRIIREIETSLT